METKACLFSEWDLFLSTLPPSPEPAHTSTYSLLTRLHIFVTVNPVNFLLKETVVDSVFFLSLSSSLSLSVFVKREGGSSQKDHRFSLSLVWGHHVPERSLWICPCSAVTFFGFSSWLRTSFFTQTELFVKLFSSLLWEQSGKFL